MVFPLGVGLEICGIGPGSIGFGLGLENTDLDLDFSLANRVFLRSLVVPAVLYSYRVLRVRYQYLVPELRADAEQAVRDAPTRRPRRV